MKKSALALGLLAMSVAMPAVAHDFDPSHDGMARYFFYRMDSNMDGYVSRPEHESFASGMFTRTDSNADGYLSYRELMFHTRSEWDDYYANYRLRKGELYEGDKYYPYGKGAPTRTPNEPFKANRDKTTRDWRDYETRDHNEDYYDDEYPPHYHR